MQRRILLLSVFTLLCLTILWSRCGGSGSKVQEVSLDDSQEVSQDDPFDATRPVTYPNHLKAGARRVSTDLEESFIGAKDDAKKDVAKQLEKRFSELFQNIFEEVGIVNDAEMLSMAEAVSRDAISVLIEQAETIVQKVAKENERFISHVMIGVYIPEVNAVLLGKIKENETLHNRIKASQSFRELEKEVAEYEQDKQKQERNKWTGSN